MEGSLAIYDGCVVYTDEVLDENFDENVTVNDVYFLSEVLSKTPNNMNLA